MLYSLKFIVLSLFTSDKKIVPSCNFILGTDSVISTLMNDTYCCYDVTEMHIYHRRIHPSERLNFGEAIKQVMSFTGFSSLLDSSSTGIAYMLGKDLNHYCVILTLQLSRFKLFKGLSFSLPDEVIIYSYVYIYILVHIQI